MLGAKLLDRGEIHRIVSRAGKCRRDKVNVILQADRRLGRVPKRPDPVFVFDIVLFIGCIEFDPVSASLGDRQLLDLPYLGDHLPGLRLTVPCI